jgi:acyl dehydratase
VLGNYGIDKLRFVKPVKPGDRIKVRLTCANSRSKTTSKRNLPARAGLPCRDLA